MPFVRHLGKTNMITHIPQDINLELKDGVLTLKAGSKVYVPNGFEDDGTTPKFDVVVIESDMQAVIPDIQRTGAFLTYNVNGRGSNLRHWSQWLATDLYSGSTTPTASGNKIWYDTTNNVIKEMNDGVNWTILQTSFPFCTFSCTSSDVTSIDQVFNGFGYIGSTVFVLPNVKGLIPSGKNEDGSLKNVEFTTDRVTTIQTSEYVSEFGIKLENNLPILGQYDAFSKYYDESSNIVTYNGEVRQWMLAGSFVYSSGKITSLTPKKVGEGIVKNKLYSLARKQKKYYKYGTEPNASIVGSPTISNGVVSGFSSSNYLTVTKSKPTIKSFEQVLKIRTGSNTAARQAFLSHNPYKGFGTLQVLDNKLIAYVSSDGSSNNIINGTQSSLTLNTNTDYWIRYAFDGSKYRIDVSTNGQDYTNYISVTSSLVVYADGFFSFGLDTGDKNNNPFLGSIDLTQSYIKINGQDWWRGTKVVESTSTDYDYYKDNLVSYSPIVRGSRTYYKQSEKQRNTGTYTFTLDKDYTAKLLFVGNGGGGGSSANDSYWRNSSGGSGACFQGRVSLPKGTYTLTIGTLGYGYCIGNTANMTGGADSTDSYLTDKNGNELIRVGCGKRGTVIGQGGAGGTLTLGTLEVLETTKAVNGNTGEWNNQYGQGVQKFAASAYDGTTTGYGAGTSSYYGGGNVYGVAGIFDLVLETDIDDYGWYVDVATKIY